MIKQIYLLYSLSVMFATFCIFLLTICLAFPSGEILINFNYYGEHVLEIILTLSALPGSFMILERMPRADL